MTISSINKFSAVLCSGYLAKELTTSSFTAMDDTLAEHIAIFKQCSRHVWFFLDQEPVLLSSFEKQRHKLGLSKESQKYFSSQCKVGNANRTTSELFAKTSGTWFGRDANGDYLALDARRDDLPVLAFALIRSGSHVVSQGNGTR